MKRNRILTVLALLLTMLSLQSCLKDQSDTFDQAPAIRLQDYMTRAQTTLESAPNGWLFEIYPGETRTMGGFAFTVKFDKGQAEVRSIQHPDSMSKSYYKITAEVGAAITFDTYNDLMHEFSNPSSSKYQADKGDFEFVIDSISNDLIRVHGYRTKNVMYLRRLNGSATDYIRQVNQFAGIFETNLKRAFIGKLGNTDVLGEIDPSTKQVTMTVGDQQQKEAFAFTPTGIRLYQPIDVGGVGLSEIDFNATASTYQAKDTRGNVTTLQADFPEWYKRFRDYEGTYDLTMTVGVRDAAGELVSQTVTNEVKLIPSNDYTYYELSGLNSNYNLRLGYDRTHYQLSLTYQILATLPNRSTVRLLPWDTESGYFTWGAGIGMNLEYNAENKRYTFVDNGVWKASGNGHTVYGFMLYAFTSAGRYVNTIDRTGATAYLINQSASITSLETLQKKD